MHPNELAELPHDPQRITQDVSVCGSNLVQAHERFLLGPTAVDRAELGA